MIRNNKAFTMVELMVTLAIIGILIVTAFPVYHTWQQRAYGSEAAAMLSYLKTAELAYYLENEHFYPKDMVISIYHDGGMEPEGAIDDVKENLNITIPQGHFIDYTISAGENSVSIVISSAGNFDLFKGAPLVSVTLDENGANTYSFAGAY